MPRRQRQPTEGVVFHLLNRSAKKLALFEGHSDYDRFIHVLRRAVERQHVALYAYCVMPNHWHLVTSVPGRHGVARFMHWLTMTHARRWQLSKGRVGQGAVYQGRYRAIAIAQDRHFLQVCRYVERNALRAGLVDQAEAWPWGSLSERPNHRDWLAPWPVPKPDDWLEMVNRPQTTSELDAIRVALNEGRSYGHVGWTPRGTEPPNEAAPRRRGRPRKQCPQQMTPDPIFTNS